ncbi:MAG: MobF family relaxase, partial [Solirubrobacteraceae bacterium]
MKIAGSGAAAYGQYLEGRTVAVDAGDYYLSQSGELVEAPGRWLLGAKGAETLGVDTDGAVAAEQFQAVMEVRNPATGEQLRASGAGGSAVAAIDATFSAPKSVSAVWALASPGLRAEIEAAQERAVDAALRHATEFVPMVRRRVDRSIVLRETPAELIASSWRHTTSRAVAGRAPDPQLHSHVVLHGAVRQGDDRVVAIESRAWLVHQREVGAAYRAQLATEFRALGFGIEAGTGRGGRYFELAGVPDGLLQQWSGRHQQVRAAIDRRLAERVSELQGQVDAGGSGTDAAAGRLAALERSGQLLPAEQRAVAMRTRAAKGKGGLQTAGDLDRAWYEAAREHGFDARSVQALLHESGRVVDVAEPELAIERRILERLTEFDATFAAREARAVALEVSAGGDPAAGLAALERLRERREILELADGRETTRAHRGAERAAVAAARALADETAPAVAQELVDEEVSELRSALALGGAQLAVEQEQAMRVACSDRRLVVIVGQAGTGKSTALTGVARAHQEAGRRVMVTSTGAQAAERLTSEFAQAGVDAAGYSTMALQAAVRRGAVTLSPEVTVIHDEAALASTREQAWLLEAVAESGARIIEVGDPRQSGAVGAGG